MGEGNIYISSPLLPFLLSPSATPLPPTSPSSPSSSTTSSFVLLVCISPLPPFLHSLVLAAYPIEEVTLTHAHSLLPSFSFLFIPSALQEKLCISNHMTRLCCVASPTLPTTTIILLSVIYILCTSSTFILSSIICFSYTFCELFLF